jgi:hypothetical protein
MRGSLRRVFGQFCARRRFATRSPSRPTLQILVDSAPLSSEERSERHAKLDATNVREKAEAALLQLALSAGVR